MLVLFSNVLATFLKKPRFFLFLLPSSRPPANLAFGSLLTDVSSVGFVTAVVVNDLSEEFILSVVWASAIAFLGASFLLKPGLLSGCGKLLDGLSLLF